MQIRFVAFTSQSLAFGYIKDQSLVQFLQVTMSLESWQLAVGKA
jgi:hypothetical protein